MEVSVPDDLPAYFSVPTALVWIATRNVGACQEMVANEKLGLGAVSPIVSKYLYPCSVTIRDKSARFEKKNHNDIADFPSSQSHNNWDIVDFLHEKGKIEDIPSLDSSSVTGPACTCTLWAPDNTPINYEYAQAERELLAAVRAGDIVARTTDPAFRGVKRRRRGNGAYKIDPVHWLGREFKDEVGADGHYHVVAAAAGHNHLRSIRFKKDDIFQKWAPEGGRIRGPKAGRTNEKDIWCSMAVEMLASGLVKPKRGVKIAIAKYIWKKGYGGYQPNTIADYISKTVDDWIAKHEAT